MASGISKPVGAIYPLPSNSEREMQQYRVWGPVVFNLGLVTGSTHISKLCIYGGASSITVSGITKTGNSTGIAILGLNVGDVIAANSPHYFTVAVSKYGPIVFDAHIEISFSNCAEVLPLGFSGTRLLYSVDVPRPITLDQAIAEAYAEAITGVVFYDTLEFLDELTQTKLLVVQSGEPLPTPQGVYTPCRFGCKHPETEGGVVGTMQITVDFLPRSAQKWILDTCKARGVVSVMWRQYLGPNQEPDAWYPVPLSVTSVEQTVNGVTVTATFPLLTAMKFPRRLMTSEALPGGRY